MEMLRENNDNDHDDLLELCDINIDHIMDNLRNRYERRIYYTQIAKSTLVSVNPNGSDTKCLYGDDYIEMYRGTTTDTADNNLRPHIFAVANSAYRMIFEQNTDCSIIVTGESGSGKTEASKLLLLFLGNVFQSSSEIENVVDTVIKSNYILESFGNAVTNCNDNSSRFGKFMEISFVRDDQHHNYDCSFATIHDYLLEKCRVVDQQQGERNFHCFYQMLSVLKSEKYADLFSDIRLADADIDSYDYLCGSSGHDVQDASNFDMVFQSMLAIGFEWEQIRCIYKVLAAILSLGNIHFDEKNDDEFGDNDHYETFVIDPESLDEFCRLLSLDCNHALLTLCSRLICTPNDFVRKNYDQTQAIQSRDALAKLLYRNLFGYILKLINERLIMQKERVVADDDRPLQINTIGILDIYGFEVLAKTNGTNGFEQFLINYSNEKLHQLFIDCYLKKEQSLYEKEDICWTKINIDNHDDICQVYHDIFLILDDICTTGNNQQQDDSVFLKYLNQHFQHNDPHFKIQLDDFGFLINHFDGRVLYGADGFVEKNLDQLYYDHLELMQTTTDPLMQKILQGDSKLRKARKNKRPSTVGQEFRQSMNTLIKRLSSRQQLYVRCIKPNESIDQQGFNENKVRHQIQYLGLVEHAKICQAGLWRQYRYEDFVRRFKMFADPQLLMIPEKIDQDLRASYQPVCKTILEKLSDVIVEDDFNNHQSDQNKKFAFGRTILFVRDPKIVECLEKKRFEYFRNCIVQVQTLARRFLAIRRFERLELTRMAFELFCRRKKLEMINKFLDKFENRYFNQYMFCCLHRPAKYLEYLDLISIRYRNKVTFSNNSRSLLDNNVYNQLLPEMIDYFNHWLIILKFPHSYWQEKVLRMDAEIIFKGNKSEWGCSRKKWLGNYLLDDNEYQAHVSASDGRLGKLVFAAKIIAPKSSSAKHYGLIMDKSAIYKMNLKHKTLEQWIRLIDIVGVSISTGSDQLVVVHGRYHNDLVFAFESCSTEQQKHQQDKTSPGIDLTTTTPSDENNKVGEFVTLLWQTIESLKINFHSDYIEFRSENDRSQIKTVTPIEWNSPEFHQILLIDDIDGDHQQQPDMTCYLIQILKSMKNNFSSKHKRRRRRRGQSSKKTNDEEDNRVKHEQRQRVNFFHRISDNHYILTYE